MGISVAQAFAAHHAHPRQGGASYAGALELQPDLRAGRATFDVTTGKRKDDVVIEEEPAETA